MIANASITLYRKRYSTALRDDIWNSTRCTVVHWHGGIGVKLLNNRYQADGSYTVRIFTQNTLDVREGDVVVRGLHDAAAPDDIPKDVAERFAVVSVVDNRRGSLRMQHWKLGGA